MSLLKYIFLSVFVSLFSFTNLWAQCKDQGLFENAWISCETSPNPNPTRGEGHWIRYDLGYTYQLSSLQVWNNNKDETLNMGVRELVMDISDDGQNWSTVDSFQVSRGPGDSYYSGEVLGQLNDIQTRYVLLTLKENWGHPTCTSLDEVSFRLRRAPLPRNEAIWVYPNPAKANATVSFDMATGESVRVKVVNLMGKEVISHAHEAISGRQEVKLNTRRLRPGVYVVQVIAGEDLLVGSKKLIIGL